MHRIAIVFLVASLSLVTSTKAAGDAGHDKGFFIRGDDGGFALRHTAQLQVRYAFSQLDGTGDADVDESRGGFEIRRAKLKLKGEVPGGWSFGVTGAFARSGGELLVEDAYAGHALGSAWHVRFGQFKAPFMREELISSTRQQAVDRSLVNEQFNQDFTQGVEFAWSCDRLAVRAMVNDGFAGDNVAALSGDVDLGLTARAEFIAAGGDAWKRFRDFSSPRSEHGTAVLLGLAGHYQHADDDPDAAPTFRAVTADVSCEFGGASLFASFVSRTLDLAGDWTDDSFGYTLQGGVFATDDVEVFARYERGEADPDDMTDLAAVTLGFNYFQRSHGGKLTVDVGYGLDPVDDAWSSSGAGWRADEAGADGQLVGRAQYQLLY